MTPRLFAGPSGSGSPHLSGFRAIVGGRPSSSDDGTKAGGAKSRWPKFRRSRGGFTAPGMWAKIPPVESVLSAGSSRPRLQHMHSNLAEHARCLYGDEYQPKPECSLEHREHHFVEELTFADADSILAMLRKLCPTWSTATCRSGCGTWPIGWCSCSDRTSRR
jgi:hypothetical protein